LRDKPEAFLDASPSGTVPCLVTQNEVIDESLDIMVWALRQNDPEGWLSMPEEGWELIARCDGPFKESLDRTKYATRYPEADTETERARASSFLKELDERLQGHLFGQPTVADFAILPFVRQFAFIDKDWFDEQHWPNLQRWLDDFLQSERFEAIMPKYPVWRPGKTGIQFPERV
jgi:glutathione S-transferase